MSPYLHPHPNKFMLCFLRFDLHRVELINIATANLGQVDSKGSHFGVYTVLMVTHDFEIPAVQFTYCTY